MDKHISISYIEKLIEKDMELEQYCLDRELVMRHRPKEYNYAAHGSIRHEARKELNVINEMSKQLEVHHKEE